MTIFHISPDELELTAIRSQGPGGQNVNKVASAIQLRFDIRASSLPLDLKERLLNLRDHRITQSGVVVIKSQEHRSQDMNRMAALLRLHDFSNWRRWRKRNAKRRGLHAVRKSNVSTAK